MNKNIQFENDKYLKSLDKQSIIYTMTITVYMSNGSVETPSLSCKYAYILLSTTRKPLLVPDPNFFSKYRNTIQVLFVLEQCGAVTSPEVASPKVTGNGAPEILNQK